MTKAEERALEAYPVRMAKCIIFPETTGADFNTLQRKSYQEGYEQAEKDMKEQFIQFVHRHYPINYTGWIQDFQKAMEDEK